MSGLGELVDLETPERQEEERHASIDALVGELKAIRGKALARHAHRAQWSGGH